MAAPADHPDEDLGRSTLRFLGDNWGYLLGTALSLVAVVWMLRLTTTVGQLTPRESTLQAILLTTASVFASWFISRLDTYFRRDDGVRRLGTQVAGGVIVLSREIDKLVGWIQKEKASSPQEENAAFGMALTHIEESLGTFRSMCIVTLGGLSDVIGNPLRRYELTLSQISELQEELSSVISAKITQAATTGDLDAVQQQIHEIRRTYETKIAELSRKTDLPTLGPSSQAPTLTPRQGRPSRSRRPGVLSPTAESVREALRKKNSYLLPIVAIAFARLAGAIDEEMRRDGVKVTPQELRTRLGARATSFLATIKAGDPKPAEVSQVVGRFFSIVFRGRLFKFSGGAKPGMLGVYDNHVTESEVVEIYVKSCLYRVWGDFKFGTEHAHLVSEVLLGASWNGGEEVAARAIRELLAGSIDAPMTEGMENVSGSLDKTALHQNL
jgi:hypothetical protein